MDAGLDALGLNELRGRPACEVIARIAEHLTGDGVGLHDDLLESALREAIFEAAAIEGDPNYLNLEVSLQSFLARDGIEGLISCFLTRYIFDRVWFLVESHVNDKTNGDIASATALASAVEMSCRSNVDTALEEAQAAGTLDTLDWFGRDGLRIAAEIAEALESRLKAL